MAQRETKHLLMRQRQCAFYTLLKNPHDLAHDLAPGYKFGEGRAIIAMGTMSPDERRVLGQSDAAGKLPPPPGGGGANQKNIQKGGGPPAALTSDRLGEVSHSLIGALGAVQTAIQTRQAAIDSTTEVDIAPDALQEEADRLQAAIDDAQKQAGDVLRSLTKPEGRTNVPVPMWRLQVIDQVKIVSHSAYDFMFEHGIDGDTLDEITTDIAIYNMLQSLQTPADVYPYLWVAGTRSHTGAAGFIFMLLDGSSIADLFSGTKQEYDGTPIMMNNEVITADKIRTTLTQERDGQVNTTRLIELSFYSSYFDTDVTIQVRNNSTVMFCLGKCQPGQTVSFVNLDINTLMWPGGVNGQGQLNGVTVSYYDAVKENQTVFSNYVIATQSGMAPGEDFFSSNDFDGYVKNRDLNDRIGYLDRYLRYWGGVSDGRGGNVFPEQAARDLDTDIAASEEKIDENVKFEGDRIDEAFDVLKRRSRLVLLQDAADKVATVVQAQEASSPDLTMDDMLPFTSADYRALDDVSGDNEDKRLRMQREHDPERLQRLAGYAAEDAQRPTQGTKRRGDDDLEEPPSNYQRIDDDDQDNMGGGAPRFNQRGGGAESEVFPSSQEVETTVIAPLVAEIKAKHAAAQQQAQQQVPGRRTVRARSPARSPNAQTGPSIVAMMCGLKVNGSPLDANGKRLVMNSVFGSANLGASSDAKLKNVQIGNLAEAVANGAFDSIIAGLQFTPAAKPDLNAKSSICDFLRDLRAATSSDAAKEGNSPGYFNRVSTVFKSADNYMREGVFSPTSKSNFKAQSLFGVVLSSYQVYVLYRATTGGQKGPDGRSVDQALGVVITANEEAFAKKVTEAIDNYEIACTYWKNVLLAAKSLTGPQKLNFTFMIVACVRAVLFAYEHSGIQTIMQSSKAYVANEFDMMTAMASDKLAKKMTVGTNIDNETYKYFMNSLKTQEQRGEFNRAAWYIDARKAPKPTLLAWLKDQCSGGNNDVCPGTKNLNALIDKFEAALANNTGFYVNNANTASVTMGDIQTQRGICSIPGIMDAMPSVCSSVQSTVGTQPIEGIEWGDFSVMISDGDGRNFGPPYTGVNAGDPDNPDGKQNITYVMQFKPSKKAKAGYPVEAEVKSYLQVGKEVLMNIGEPNNMSPGLPGNYQALTVDLTGGAESPLQASNCFRTLARVVLNWGGGAGWIPFLSAVSANDATGQQLRREILGVSHRKAMGDILQELIAVVKNGGYADGTWQHYPATRPMLQPDQGRMFFANDKPSGTRYMYLTLYGRGDVNPNCFGGFMNQSGAFGAAYRAAPAAGGRRRRTRRRVKRRRNTRKKKRTAKKKPKKPKRPTVQKRRKARKNNKKRTRRNRKTKR